MPIVQLDEGSIDRPGRGVALGLGPVEGVPWLALDGAIVLSEVATVTLGFAVLRHLHARSGMFRAWATVGAGLALALVLLIGLD